MTYSEILLKWRDLIADDPAKLKVLEIMESAAINPSFDMFAKIMPEKFSLSVTFNCHLALYMCDLSLRRAGSPYGVGWEGQSSVNSTQAILAAMSSYLEDI